MGGGGGQVQINIEPGAKFDYDSQLSDLRGDVAKIKKVLFCVLGVAWLESGGLSGAVCCALRVLRVARARLCNSHAHTHTHTHTQQQT
jgi:hypothetical protein